MNRYSILISVFCVFIGACSTESSGDQISTLKNSSISVHLSEQQLKNIQVSTTSFVKTRISETLNVVGKIDVPPQNLVSISVPLGGYLKSTHLLPGMEVREGEVIAYIEDQKYIELQQNYLLTKEKYSYAEKEYARQKELNLSKASSDKTTQLAETELQNLKISFHALAEQLKLIYINPQTLDDKSMSKSIPLYAPIHGFVSKVNMNIGRYVNPSDILFELVNPKDIHLNLHVYEKDVINLYIGQRVQAFSNAKPSEKHNCEIILISRDVAADGTTEVHCHFENYDKNLLPGMYMNAELEIFSDSAYVLPEECLVSSEGKDFVFVQKDQYVFDLKEVVTGKRQKGLVEIRNAADFKNRNIVLKGAYTLLMEMKKEAQE